MRSVGAGGGSIADVSELTGSLRVGPRSAGARPGPVAYGRGGTEPTVSDANIVLGYLPPLLLGGEMALDADSSRKAVAKIGEQLKLSAEDAAKGIIDIANEVMLGALRVITVQRGLDPREFGIVAFGGAGPLHANALAELLGCYPVLVPPNPGVLCALGFLEADFRNEFVQTLHPLHQGARSPGDLVALRRARGKGTGLARPSKRLLRRTPRSSTRLDLRYEQQGFEVAVPVERRGCAEEGRHRQGARRFPRRARASLWRALPRAGRAGRPARCCPGRDAIGRRDRAGRFGARTSKAAIIETRNGYFDGAWQDTPHYDRGKLGVGARIEGPAIIRQYDTTTVLLPGHYAEIDKHGNILIWPVSKRQLSVMTTKATQRVDPITLDIIENALKNARFEMDGVVVRVSLSPVIREQHDEFPMICNERGQMIVGQFGSYIPAIVEKFEGDINEGDIFVWNDPYACKGSISHNNDWCVMMPIFHEKVLVGFSSIFGHMVDVGGMVPGSMPANARTIWDEGLRIPPVRIYDKGVLNKGVLDIMLNNTRTPDMNRADLMALIAGCRTASTRVRELCDRFGRDDLHGRLRHAASTARARPCAS